MRRLGRALLSVLTVAHVGIHLLVDLEAEVVAEVVLRAAHEVGVRSLDVGEAGLRLLDQAERREARHQGLQAPLRHVRASRIELREGQLLAG